MKPIIWIAASLGVTVLIAGCGSHPSAKSPHGKANVAYAGSLEEVNDQVIGPDFSHTTGYQYVGQGGGSFGMAQKLASHTINANVFESVGYAPIQILEPKFTRWAVSFASSPLVIAFNPKSRYGPELTAIQHGKKPLTDLFRLIESPGFRLGRTNPGTDPQGQAFYMMVELAERRFHLPSDTTEKVLGAPDNPHQVYSEEGILTLLQSGSLDAASAFLSEAEQRHLDYIPLPRTLNFADPSENAWYHQASVTTPSGVVHGSALTIDITTVGKATPAAQSFIHFVLSPRGRTLMQKVGYTTFPAHLYGTRSAVPKKIRAELP